MKILSILFLSGFAVIFASEISDYAASNRLFSSALYKEVAKVNNKSFLVSPLSAHIILALALAGAKEKTADQLSKGLHLPKDPEDIKKIIQPLLSSISNVSKVKLTTANKMYIRDNFKVNETFQELAVKSFGAETDLLDFTNTSNAADVINKWVESKTENRIKKLVDKDVINEDTALVLVNALHFKGTWEYPFEESFTKKMPFYVTPKEKIEIDTMNAVNTYLYAENKELDARFLQLPYENEEVTMTIVLPNQKDGLKALEARLDEVLKTQKYSEQNVDVQIPKFKTEFSLDLIPALKEFGVMDAFISKANFSGIANGTLYISAVKQKTFINVNEAGTEAAAATAVTLTDRIGGRPIAFVADHPFLYILQTNRNEILFIGRH